MNTVRVGAAMTRNSTIADMTRMILNSSVHSLQIPQRKLTMSSMVQQKDIDKLNTEEGQSRALCVQASMTDTSESQGMAEEAVEDTSIDGKRR